MAPKKLSTTLGVIYLVEQDPRDGRWNITRGGKPAGGIARDKNTAIGLAYADASREAHTTNLKVEVWSVQAGKRKKEWESAKTR